MNEEAKPGDSDVTGTQSPENADTGKSLDQLLDEFDSGAKADSTDQSEIEGLRAQVAALTAAEGERRYTKEMNDFIIPEIKGDFDIDDFVVESWANKQASEDPRLRKLWDEREDNPRQFRQAITALKPEFEKFAEGKIVVNKEPDGNLASAVRQARESNVTPTSHDDINWAGMSDQDFQLKKQEIFRLQEQGKL